MPTILREAGFRFHFYLNEGNEPAHIHAVGRGGEIKIWLASLEIDSCYGLSAKDQRQALEITTANVRMFLEKWNEFIGTKQ